MVVTRTTHIALTNIILTGVTSSLSILGAVLIFLTYWKIPEIRNFSRRLLLYLTIADVLTATGNLVGMARYVAVYGDEDLNTNMNVSNCSDRTVTDFEHLCIAQSFVTTFSNMASYFWTLVIAVHLWTSMQFSTDMTETSKFHGIYHCICWLLPLGIVSWVLSKGVLGEDYCFGTGVWCGIRSNLSHAKIELFMYISDVAWQLTSYTLSAFFFIFLTYTLYRENRKRRRLHGLVSDLSIRDVSTNLREEDRNYLFVPLYLYCIKLPGILRFFLSTYLPVHELEKDNVKSILNVLLGLQSAGSCAQATVNAIVFCLCDKVVRTRLKLWLSCSPRPKTQTEESHLLDYTPPWRQGHTVSESRKQVTRT